jgi:hypothetical protein
MNRFVEIPADQVRISPNAARAVGFSSRMQSPHRPKSFPTVPVERLEGRAQPTPRRFGACELDSAADAGGNSRAENGLMT